MSVNSAPDACLMNRGDSFTLCSARTGLLTPPGIYFSASRKASFDFIRSILLRILLRNR